MRRELGDGEDAARELDAQVTLCQRRTCRAGAWQLFDLLRLRPPTHEALEADDGLFGMIDAMLASGAPIRTRCLRRRTRRWTE